MYFKLLSLDVWKVCVCVWVHVCVRGLTRDSVFNIPKNHSIAKVRNVKGFYHACLVTYLNNCKQTQEFYFESYSLNDWAEDHEYVRN